MSEREKFLEKMNANNQVIRNNNNNNNNNSNNNNNNNDDGPLTPLSDKHVGDEASGKLCHHPEQCPDCLCMFLCLYSRLCRKQPPMKSSKTIKFFND